MKPSLYAFVGYTVALTLIIVGCQSMYDDTAPTPAPEASTTPTGAFPDNSHSIPGGGPPPTAQEDALGEETQSHFRALQVDPEFEDTAGPKFLKIIDMNGDGLLDVVSGHNQSQPVQIHFQQQVDDEISFNTVSLGGTFPISVMGGIDVADMDQDGNLDVVVLVKHTGEMAYCLNGDKNTSATTGEIIILFAPAPGGDLTDGDAWTQVEIEDSHSGINSRWGREAEGGRAIDFPETGGYTGLSVGDIDGVNGPDIVVTSNVPEDPCNTGWNVVEIWYNPGANARTGASQNITTNAAPALTMPPTFWYPAWIDIDAPEVKDCELLDIDQDGDLDIIAAYSNAVSQNVRWYQNPTVEQGSNVLIQGTFVNNNLALYSTAWTSRPVGTVDGSIGAMTLGDLDNDSFDDVLVRSETANAVLWFRLPTDDTSVEPQFPSNTAPVPTRTNFPWQVYVMDFYGSYRPNGIAIGDLTNDGFSDVAIAVGGALYWYDHSTSESTDVFDQWGRDFLLDDTKAQGATDDPSDLDYVAEGTIINNLVIADIDGDGVNDIVATFDRMTDGGLHNDAIIWFRNTLFDEES